MLDIGTELLEDVHEQTFESIVQQSLVITEDIYVCNAAVEEQRVINNNVDTLEELLTTIKPEDNITTFNWAINAQSFEIDTTSVEAAISSMETALEGFKDKAKEILGRILDMFINLWNKILEFVKSTKRYMLKEIDRVKKMKNPGISKQDKTVKVKIIPLKDFAADYASYYDACTNILSSFIKMQIPLNNTIMHIVDPATTNALREKYTKDELLHANNLNGKAGLVIETAEFFSSFFYSKEKETKKMIKSLHAYRMMHVKDKADRATTHKPGIVINSLITRHSILQQAMLGYAKQIILILRMFDIDYKDEEVRPETTINGYKLLEA